MGFSGNPLTSWTTWNKRPFNNDAVQFWAQLSYVNEVTQCGVLVKYCTRRTTKVPPALTINNSAFFPQIVFTSFMWFSE
jgi:hypothetical protein